MHSLKYLGVSSDSYGNLLSSVLLSKLPQELRLIISRKMTKDDWILATLMEELEQEIKARAANPVQLLLWYQWPPNCPAVTVSNLTRSVPVK